LFKSIGSTWILNLLQIVVLMALWPFVLGTLGTEQNGVWVTIVAFTDIWKLLILGVPMASVRQIATAVARKDPGAVNRAISTCLGICLALGAGAFAIAAASYFFFEARFLQGALGSELPPSVADGARIAFAITAVQVGLGFAMRLPYAVFDAHGDFVIRNLILAGELCLRCVLTVALLSWRPELPMLAIVVATCMLAEFAATLVVIRLRYPGVRVGLAHFDRSLVRGIFGFSLFAMVLNVGALLAFRMDAIVIGAHLEAEQATFFDNGNKFFDPLMQLLIAVSAVVMPLAARAPRAARRPSCARCCSSGRRSASRSCSRSACTCSCSDPSSSARGSASSTAIRRVTCWWC
jgi:O-antigen/teichoic acid export membrane protein